MSKCSTACDTIGCHRCLPRGNAVRHLTASRRKQPENAFDPSSTDEAIRGHGELARAIKVRQPVRQDSRTGRTMGVNSSYACAKAVFFEQLLGRCGIPVPRAISTLSERANVIVPTAGPGIHRDLQKTTGESRCGTEDLYTEW